MPKQQKKKAASLRPDHILFYFRSELAILLIITLGGTLCNIGVTAGPWLEGQMAQTLLGIFQGTQTARDMAWLAGVYVLVIAAVQAMRFLKRFFVRRFANTVGRDMKRMLYRNLVHRSRADLLRESIGTTMTKAISDVDTCTEGMRKFTTEIFDTGVLLVCYFLLLLVYDWRLTLLSCLFVPVAYLLAARLRGTVARRAADYKESAGRLSGATMDRVSGALSYRILGQEPARDTAYEACLQEYETAAIRTNVLETALQPLYLTMCMCGAMFLIWHGVKNVQGGGWAVWNIAAFTTYITCFSKLSVRASKAAKLFNAVQKAQVSWARIKPLLGETPPEEELRPAPAAALTVEDLACTYPDGNAVLHDVTFTAAPGELIGVAGAVASGKSTLGQVFLCEMPYRGHVRLGTTELSALRTAQRCSRVGYMGHDPELISGTIRENICMGYPLDPEALLRLVCMDREVAAMPDGLETRVGAGGVRLSGGQQARIALARTLGHKRPLLVLDDPFSALDRATERTILQNLRAWANDSVVLLISHRLYLFDEADRVLFLQQGSAVVGTQPQLLAENEAYEALYREQTGGAL